MKIENKKILHTDILIIGGGTAGCYAALTIREKSDYSIIIAEKANIKRSGCLAAGVNAINAYIVKGRKPEDYVDYAKKDADGIVREDLLMTMSEGLNRVTDKMEKLGLVILKDENGEYVGFDLDLAAEVCTRNGWELVKKPINWDSKDMELNTEVISCIWNGFTMQGREDKYTWSEAYVDNSQVIVVKKDSGIATYADLAGKIVAVQADSSALAALTENEDGSNAENIALAESFKQMVEVPDYNTAFLNLEAGAVDAIAMDIGVAQYQISQRGDEFVILDGTIALSLIHISEPTRPY